MKVIALEEHCASPGFMKGPGRVFQDRAQSAGNFLTVHLCVRVIKIELQTAMLRVC